MGSIAVWVGFLLFVFALMAVDLGLFHKKAHAVSTKEAGIWTAVWVSLALSFNVGVYFFAGKELAINFLTGYLVEYSLSVDNIFVFILLFSYFKVDPAYRHRVLFWGILGALIFRGLLIGVGTALIAKFHWIIYVFGAFLIFTGIKMAFSGEAEPEPDKNPVVGFFKRHFPVASSYHGDAFFIKPEGTTRWYATPLFIVLLVIETTDIMFALDSIPAIFGITNDPFIVFTSNVFAIMGLRSLYFLLDGVVDLFRYLKFGLTFVLCFIGIKMVLSDLWHVPTALSLGVVASILGISIIASIVHEQIEKRAHRKTDSPS
ncbi:MAG TPA: TerC family protein [Symbiobacteriaceae bacterium]|nr:TerC family protein [Symbiobacteriaceae bacterium]